MLMLPLTNRKNQRRWVAAMFYTLIAISGAPRARQARAERSTMGKKIW